MIRPDLSSFEKQLRQGASALRDDLEWPAEPSAVADHAAGPKALDRYVAGALTAEERQALERAASSHEALRTLLAACRPMSSTTKDALATKLQAKLRARLNAKSQAAGTAAPKPGLAGKIIPISRGRKFRMWAAGGAVAAAAAFVLFVRSPSVSPIVPYSLELSGDAQELRGAEGASNAKARTFDDQSRVSLVVRPTTSIPGPLAARAFLIDARGTVRPVHGAFEASNEGSFRLAGPTGQIFGDARGDFTLMVVVGRPEALENAAERATGTLDAGPGWQRLSVAVHLGR